MTLIVCVLSEQNWDSKYRKTNTKWREKSWNSKYTSNTHQTHNIQPTNKLRAARCYSCEYCTWCVIVGTVGTDFGGILFAHSSLTHCKYLTPCGRWSNPNRHQPSHNQQPYYGQHWRTAEPPDCVWCDHSATCSREHYEKFRSLHQDSSEMRRVGRSYSRCPGHITCSSGMCLLLLGVLHEGGCGKK